MKLIVGLGNWGEKYLNTRHNAGFVLIDKLVSNLSEKTLFSLDVEKGWVKKEKLSSVIFRIPSIDFVFCKSIGQMNNSGDSVVKLINHFHLNVSDLWILHDDLDIRLGDFKIQKGTGPKDHKGIISIEEKTGTSNFWRVRIGVDNRDPENRTLGETYVLQKFEKEEMDILNGTADRIIAELYDIWNFSS